MSNRVTAKEWRRRVEGWKRSGETATQYGGRFGIDPQQLRWWKWWLGKEPGRGRESFDDKEVRFLPVKVERKDEDVPRGGVEVVLPGCITVKIAEGSDPEWVGRVVRGMIGEQ